MADGEPAVLTGDQLARAVRVEPSTVDELADWGFLRPDEDGLFKPSDIQRVRAVQAMRSPGIALDQLIEAFRGRLFTLQPMDQLYPMPAVVTDTTPADLAASLGLGESDVIRLMTAAGFPAPLPGVPMREDDIRLLRELVANARVLGGDEVGARLARTFGDTARRAAEAGVAMFAENVNSPVVNADLGDDGRAAVSNLAARLMAGSEVLLGELYRRHLEHTLMRQWATAAETFLDQIGVRAARPQLHGVAFVDLTGYTPLTASRGDATAVRLASDLADLAEDAVARHNGRVVKLLGDGAMLHFEDRHDAVRGALALVELIAVSDLPPGHAGVHAGPVIERDGDYFGQTVNLAARISAQAGAGEVLVSADLVRNGPDDLAFQSQGTRAIKGVGDVELFVAAPARTLRS